MSLTNLTSLIPRYDKKDYFFVLITLLRLDQSKSVICHFISKTVMSSKLLKCNLPNNSPSIKFPFTLDSTYSDSNIIKSSLFLQVTTLEQKVTSLETVRQRNSHLQQLLLRVFSLTFFFLFFCRQCRGCLAAVILVRTEEHA